MTTSDPQPPAFFPPLSSLLSSPPSRSTRLISLHLAHHILTRSPTFADANSPLEKFCYDSPTFSLLARVPDSLPTPSAKSKSDFEARTAPIEVSGSQNGEYDLEQMKADALALSAEVGVEEAEALSVNGAVKPAIDFADGTTRRRRQLDIFLKERSARLKLSADLLARQATRGKDDAAETWVDDLAQQIFKGRFKLDTDPTAVDQVWGKCMAALDEQIQILDDPTKLPKMAQESEETVPMFTAATFADIVTILRLLLIVLHVRKDVSTSAMVLAWFQKLESVNYFLTLSPSPAWPDTTELQCLIAIISFTILSPSAAVSQLQGLVSRSTGGVSYPRLQTGDYFEDESCMSELNVIFYRAALNEITILSPAIFAWAIVTTPIRNVARKHTEAREKMIADGSSDNESPHRRRASRRDSRDDMSVFEKLFAALQSFELDSEVREDPCSWFAKYAELSIFGVVAQLSTSVTSIYASDLGGATQYIARTHLLQLFREGTALLFYGEEMLEAMLATLTPGTAGDSHAAHSIDARLSSSFIEDETLRQAIFDQTLTRYPYEVSPLLRLMTSLASAYDTVHNLVEVLEGLQTMTLMVPEHFNGYTLINEDENTNEIRLEEDIPLFTSRQALSWYGPNAFSRKALTMGGGGGSGGERGMDVMAIPAGTSATILKESRPMVFKLELPHSGLEYLSLLLNTRLPNSEMCVEPSQPSVDLGTAADIVALMNALLTACLKGWKGEGGQGKQDAEFILGRMSDALPDEIDIVNVVIELFEAELLAHLEQTAQQGSLELLIACAELFAQLVRIEPARCWAALARSSLLGLNGGGTNALAAVVGATETTLGSFRFLSACTGIFTSLVGDGVGGMVKRRPVEEPAKKRGRFDSPVEREEYTPERTIQRVLSAFTGVMLEAWDSLKDWRFVDPVEKAGIAMRICEGFTLLLRATYGLQEPEDPESDVEEKEGRRKKKKKKKPRLASILFPAADAVLDFFAPDSGSTTSMHSFSAALAEAAAAVVSGAEDSGRGKSTEPMLALLIALLRTSRSIDQEKQGQEGKRAYGVATQLLKAIPDLVVLFTAETSLKKTIATLLAEITTSLSGTGAQSNPPSLLGHLSTSSAKAFLAILSQLDRPLCDPATERAIWDFLSTVMKGRQQWLTLYLLTGTVHRERLSQSTTDKADGGSKSLLTYALAQLCHIEDLAPERSIALLRFVSAAQGASVLASNEVRQHNTLLKSIIDWVDGLPALTNTTNVREQILRAAETRKAGLICEVLAQAVYAGGEVGDFGVLKMLRGKLSWLSENGGQVNAWNHSLHQKLGDNFRARFSGVDIEVFRRSAADLTADAKEEIRGYDLEIMDQALAHEKAWAGTTNHQGGKSNGFRDEASRANVNFALMAAQEGLLGAWSALATTLVESLGGADEITKADVSRSLAIAVKNGCEANAQANLDVPGMDGVMMMRAEMGFVVLSKLTSSITAPTVGTRAILPAASRALTASPADFDIATQEEELQYYRLCLQILVLAVQPHLQSLPKSMATSDAVSVRGEVRATDETPLSFLEPATAGTLADIVMRVVGPAWRALAGNLHTNFSCALPSDFALVISLLQAVLAVPGVEVVNPRIAEVVASLQLVRSALSLYSWADQLAESMDGDPVYGELAVQFVQVLSTVRPVAEHIALESALPILASANLSSYFRKAGGKGPFDEPRRMFSIWTEGMLPLCLNLLDAVGPPVAGEVSNFLNGFPLQLERANAALENRDPTKYQPHAGAVTWGLVQEAHSLCLISMILQSDSARAAAEGIEAGGGLQGYDYKKGIEDGAGLVRQKASLASRITPANGVEAAWAGRMVDGVDTWLSARIFREVEALARLAGEGGEDV